MYADTCPVKAHRSFVEAQGRSGEAGPGTPKNTSPLTTPARAHKCRCRYATAHLGNLKICLSTHKPTCGNTRECIHKQTCQGEIQSVSILPMHLLQPKDRGISPKSPLYLSASVSLPTPFPVHCVSQHLSSTPLSPQATYNRTNLLCFSTLDSTHSFCQCSPRRPANPVTPPTPLPPRLSP